LATHFLLLLLYNTGFGASNPKKVATHLLRNTGIERFTYLDKLDLVKFAYGGLVLGLSLFLLLPTLPKNLGLLQKWSEQTQK